MQIRKQGKNGLQKALPNLRAKYAPEDIWDNDESGLNYREQIKKFTMSLISVTPAYSDTGRERERERDAASVKEKRGRREGEVKFG